MTTTQYIGARYVPLFAEPIDWDNKREYEPLTIVYWQGNSYTSRQAVPKGVDIFNDDYWALTGNYNAQIEQYRKEVATFNQRITDNSNAIKTEATTRKEADDALRTRLVTVEGITNGLGTASKRGVTANITDQDPYADALVTSAAVYGVTHSNTVKINEINARLGAPKKAILIGDSYLRTYSNNIGWGDAFADITGFECSKYKAGDAGFINLGGGSEPEAGLNFNGMLEKAKNERTTDQRKDIDYVVCQGLINDLQTNKGASDIVSAVQTFARNARAWFPNAKIIITTGIASTKYVNSPVAVSVNNALKNNMPQGVLFAADSFMWFWGLDSSYNRGDNIHPSEIGYNYLASKIANVALYGNTVITRSLTSSQILKILEDSQPNITNWVSSDAWDITLTGNVITAVFNFKIKDDSKQPSGNSYVYLPIPSVGTTAYSIAPVYASTQNNYCVNLNGIRKQAESTTINNIDNWASNSMITLNASPHFTIPGQTGAKTMVTNDTFNFYLTRAIH